MSTEKSIVHSPENLYDLQIEADRLCQYCKDLHEKYKAQKEKYRLALSAKWPTKKINKIKNELDNKLVSLQKCCDDLYALGGKFKDKQNFGFAQQCYASALEIVKEAYPGKISQELGIYVCLGDVCQKQDQVDAARRYFEKALVLQKRFQHGGSLDEAGILNNLGNTCKTQGEFNSAQGYYEEALTLQERFHPEGSLEEAQILTNLGHICKAQGKFNSAQGYYEKALTLQPEGSLDEADILNNLGNICRIQNQFDQARTYCEKALALKKSFHPEGSLDEVPVLHSLGNICQAQNQFDAAKSYYEQAITLQKYFHPEGSLDEATILNNWGNICQAENQFYAVLPYYTRAQAIYERLIERGNITKRFYIYSEFRERLARIHQLISQSSQSPEVRLSHLQKAINIFEDLYQINYEIVTDTSIALSEFDLRNYISMLVSYLNTLKQLNILCGDGFSRAAIICKEAAGAEFYTRFPLQALVLLGMAHNYYRQIPDSFVEQAQLYAVQGDIYEQLGSLAVAMQYAKAACLYHDTPEYAQKLQQLEDVYQQQYKFVDADLRIQLEGNIIKAIEVQQAYLKDCQRGNDKPTVTTENLTVELIVNLRHLWDQAYGRMIQAIWTENKEEKEEADVYFPMGTSKLSFIKNLIERGLLKRWIKVQNLFLSTLPDPLYTALTELEKAGYITQIINTQDYQLNPSYNSTDPCILTDTLPPELDPYLPELRAVLNEVAKTNGVLNYAAFGKRKLKLIAKQWKKMLGDDNGHIDRNGFLTDIYDRDPDFQSFRINIEGIPPEEYNDLVLPIRLALAKTCAEIKKCYQKIDLKGLSQAIQATGIEQKSAGILADQWIKLLTQKNYLDKKQLTPIYQADENLSQLDIGGKPQEFQKLKNIVVSYLADCLKKRTQLTKNFKDEFASALEKETRLGLKAVPPPDAQLICDYLTGLGVLETPVVGLEDYYHLAISLLEMDLRFPPRASEDIIPDINGRASLDLYSRQIKARLKTLLGKRSLEDLDEAYKLLCEVQPFYCYSETANEQNSGLWQTSVLEKIVRMAAAGKHIYLIPQEIKDALVGQLGLLRQKNIKLYIDYLEPNIYTWSFVNCLGGMESDVERLTLSREIWHRLKDQQHISYNELHQCQRPDHPLSNRYRELRQQRKDETECLVARKEYEDTLITILPEKAKPFVTSISNLLLSRGLQRGQVARKADLREEIQPFLNRLLQETKKVVLTFSQAHVTVCGHQPVASLPIFYPELTHTVDYAKRDEFRRDQCLVDVEPWVESLLLRPTSSFDLNMLHLTHEKLLEVETALRHQGKFVQIANYYQSFAHHYRHEFPWLALLYYNKALVLHIILSDHNETTLTCLEQKGTLCLDLELTQEALDTTRRAQIFAESIALSGTRAEQIGDLKKRCETYQNWLMARIDRDLISQLNHNTAQYYELCQLCFRHSLYPEDSLLKDAIHNLTLTWLIKMRHILDQIWTRLVKHTVHWPNGYEEITEFNINYPYKNIESQLREKRIPIAGGIAVEIDEVLHPSIHRRIWKAQEPWLDNLVMITNRLKHVGFPEDFYAFLSTDVANYKGRELLNLFKIRWKKKPEETTFTYIDLLDLFQKSLEQVRQIVHQFSHCIQSYHWEVFREKIPEFQQRGDYQLLFKREGLQLIVALEGEPPSDSALEILIALYQSLKPLIDENNIFLDRQQIQFVARAQSEEEMKIWIEEIEKNALGLKVIQISEPSPLTECALDSADDVPPRAVSPRSPTGTAPFSTHFAPATATVSEPVTSVESVVLAPSTTQ